MAEEKIWKTVLGEMEIILPKVQFSTWFRGTRLEHLEDKCALISVSNSYARDWLKNKYEKMILMAIKKVKPEIEKVTFQVASNKPMERLALEVKATPKDKGVTDRQSNNLNGHYTFENFVVGNNNSLAYAVAKEVADNPGKKHNPLFIYGGVGLGKTHLAQAIGQELYAKRPEARINYVSCETFTNDFISAIASKKMAEFKRNYRDVDILIIDDIQFLSSKEGSQEEFFHTFNSLHQKSRQIVMTADKIPQAIPALEGRLASRFGGGMVVDIQPPNFETRIAILKEKCREKSCFMSDETIEFIAKNISSNIRELGGALNRLATHCQFNSVQPTPRLAEEVLKDLVSSSNRAVDTAEIISAVSKYFNIPQDEIVGKSRKKELILPRQISIFLIREQTNKSLPEIGKIFGGKDHTTVLHSEKKMSNEIKIDLALKSDIEKIRSKLFEVK